MGYECKLRHQNVQPTLSLGFRAPRASLTLEFRRAYATLDNYTGEAGARRAGPAHDLTCVGLVSEFYLDDPVVTPFPHLRTKIALPVGPA